MNYLHALLVVVALLVQAPSARIANPAEYRLKAAFLYNFALFTEWPATVGSTLQLCVHGASPFGDTIDALHGKAVGTRTIALQRPGGGQPIEDCHIVFIAASEMDDLPRVLQRLRHKPALTVADWPGAAAQGVALNLAVESNRITFSANPSAARMAGLKLSSKLLRLATRVHP